MNRWSLFALAALACGIEAAAADAPVVVYSAKPMPATFAVLTDRSIFYKGREVPVPRIYFPRPVGPATTSPTADAATMAAAAAAAAEQTLVFSGVTKADNVIDAFIEDQNSSKVTMYRIGEPIARGKITNITLDDLTYEQNGKTIHVSVGENLQGVMVQTTQPSVVSSGSSNSSETAAPNNLNSSGGSGGGDTNDVLERLRKRRQQELQGK
jgi:hypothetical protein